MWTVDIEGDVVSWSKVTLQVTSGSDDGFDQPPNDRSPTMSTNHDCSRPTSIPLASIHPVASQPVNGKPPSPPVGDGDVDSTGSVPHVTERLVLSVDDAAYLLNISRAFAYELVARGELPAIRLGRRIVIPRAALDELLGTAIVS